MKKIIVSGINFYNGGPLSVYKDCLNYLSNNLCNEYKIIALVHKKELYSDIKNIELVEFPDSRKSWIRRLYYEYYYFYKLSLREKPYLWLSMHDITPNVKSCKRAVYCHNPMPFYKMSWIEMRLDKVLALFNLFYKYLYKLNIYKNDFVVVQQDWIRDKFISNYKLCSNKVIVSKPEVPDKIKIGIESMDIQSDLKSFFYPTFPRVFKNIEVICEACKILEEKGINNFRFEVTIKGDENAYSKWIFNKYQNLKTIKFIGSISREDVYKKYAQIDALIFPSKLETWGLPISEYSKSNKIIILSDLKYAKETLGKYEKCLFFNPNNPLQLALLMEKIILDKDIEFCPNTELNPEYPYCENWDSLFNLLLDRGERI